VCDNSGVGYSVASNWAELAVSTTIQKQLEVKQIVGINKRIKDKV